MRLKAALAVLCLGVWAAPAAAVPFQECSDWLETFEIGNVNPAGDDFVDGYAPSPDRPVILSRAGDLMEEALHHAAAFYRVTLKLTAPPKLLPRGSDGAACSLPAELFILQRPIDRLWRQLC